MNQAYIFANPIAGRGRGRSIAEQVAQRLARQGIRAHLFEQLPGDLSDAQLQCDTNPLAAICIGGDGTLRSAAERLLRYCGDVERIPPLLLVPLGTANLMARHLGIAWNRNSLAVEVTAAVLKQRVVKLDAARANGRVFLLMAGVGLDAMVVHDLHRRRRGPIGLLSYAMPLLKALRQYTYPPLRVELDGHRIWDGQSAIAFVGNVPEYGTGFPILTKARPDDGVLDVCVMPCSEMADVLHHAMAAVTGNHVQAEGVVYAKGKVVRIDSPEPVAVQIDGEAAEHTPLNIELLAGGLRFIVP